MNASQVEVPEGSVVVVLTEDEVLAYAKRLDPSHHMSAEEHGLADAARRRIEAAADEVIHASRASRRTAKR
ncbi:hypothetical protein [Pseudoclavibacter helvolus]|uniref:hypothetical protein n=1 Tax=Pseudoclavibacter helvolus TaxID=255205 RepID=UPI0037357AF2